MSAILRSEFITGHNVTPDKLESAVMHILKYVTIANLNTLAAREEPAAATTLARSGLFSHRVGNQLEGEVNRAHVAIKNASPSRNPDKVFHMLFRPKCSTPISSRPAGKARKAKVNSCSCGC